MRAGGEIAATARKKTKARTAPVSARGSFTHSLSIQVPPGRLGMTPSLGLGYDSANVAESPVGVGWSFGTGRISRSTRLGYPAVVGPDYAPFYASSTAVFTGPDGELVPSSDGPAGAVQAFAPLREMSPARYEFVNAGDRWVEHAPSGVKKYYGVDPFDGRTMRVVNELGTFTWLLLREEDPHGNYIKYDYHNAAAQSRAERYAAQVSPILSKVEWGGNRLTGLAPPFAVTTVLEAQPGPLNVLEGNTILEHRIRRFDVAIDGVTRWSYTLGYLTSVETGKSLLQTFSRDLPAETTTFSYSTGAPVGARFEAMGPLHAGAGDRFYTEGAERYDGPFHAERHSFQDAVQASGHRAGVRFIDIDGNGTTDAIYHAAGIGTTSTHILWEESRLQEANPFGLGGWVAPALGDPTRPSNQPNTGLPYFPFDGQFSRSDFPEATLRELVDVDGDGDVDGISLPVALLPRNGNGVLVSLPPAHYPPAYPSAAMPVKIHTNTARAGGVTHTDVTVPWPPDVGVSSVIYATQPDPSAVPPPAPLYKVEPHSDVNAPPVDLNGDGKTDLVLLKHRANILAWRPWGGAFGVSAIAVMRMYAMIEAISKAEKVMAFGGMPGLPPVGEINKGNIGEDVDRFVREDRAFVFVDRGLLNKAERPEQYVVLNVSAKAAGIPELEPTRPIVLISGLDGLPYPGSEGGRKPPIGAPEEPEILDYLTEKPWWYPVQDPEGDVWLPLRDHYYLGGGGLGANAFFGDFHYVPRVYVMRGEATRQLTAESEIQRSDFERSLQAHLNNGSPDECFTTQCAFPAHVNFNTFFADLNGDGLPDLIRAPTPNRVTDGAGEKLVCDNGHEVYLNRGYVFESWQNSLASFAFGAAEGANAHPLKLVANRDRSCVMTRPRMVDSALGALYFGPRYPLSAMAQTDINADGRVDLVVAYQTKAWDSHVEQHVYLNTGRGFREVVDYSLPTSIALARDIGYPSQPGSTAFEENPYGGAWPRDGLSDTARFVDLDGDGLVDIASAGVCSRSGLLTVSCQRPVWFRNRGNIPDRLERVDENSGAWTTVEYAGPKSGIVTVTEGGFRPPPSARFVSKVRSAAGPATVPAGYDSFPVEEVRFSYENYVRDVVSNEQIGFERVREVFVNAFDGVELENVVVTQTFDVRPLVAGVGGTAVPVRHPLKGAQVSVVSESGSWTSAEIREYRVESLGAGVRVRPSRVLTGESDSAGVAQWTAEDHRAFDGYGNPTLTVIGNFNGTDIGLGSERRTTQTTYENRTDARWQIGLATQRRLFGYSESADGNVQQERLLAATSTDYNSRGAVATATRVNVRGEFCDGPADNVTTYEYWPDGQVKIAHEPNGRNISTTYDTKSLYAARVEVKVGKIANGVFTPATTVLARTFETDLRTGERTRQTEADGSVENFSYDARGRLLTRVLCPSTVPACSTSIMVESNVYTDTFPVKVVSTIRTDTSATFDRVRYSDGDGHTLAIVEGESAGDKSLKERARYDAFGRAREAYLPKFVATFADAAKVPTGPRVTTSYDGFDRPRMVRRADSTTTSYAYEPRVTLETNPRGFVTKRTYDVFGDISTVERNPGGVPSETSTHTIVRDGMGAVVRVVDGDGSIRRLERDGGGRIRYLTLPGNGSASSAKFSLCHDVDDKLVRLETPAGRVVTTVYDELGRALVTEGTDDSGLFVQNTQVYDEPVAGGLGRLTTKNDESGAYKMTYDGYGRPASLRFDPSARAKAGATNVAASYAANFAYSPAGQLKNATITGLPSAAELRYTRDARGRVRKVESKAGSEWTTVADAPAFDAGDRLTSAAFGNLTTGTWTYGPLSERLDAITYKTAAGEVLASVSYSFDADGNPKQEDRYRRGTTGIHSQKLHDYDALDRLVSSEAQSPAGNALQTYTFSPGGNLLSAAGDVYTYSSQVTSQAASYLSNTAKGMSRTLSYESDGFLHADTKVEAALSETRTITFDPLGCIRNITAEKTGSPMATSEYTCGLNGTVVGRATTKADGTRSRRIDFAGLGEIRPDEGIFMIRIPVAGSVSVEDARLLSNGTRSASLSGYLVNDARGSVLAATGWDSDTTISREAEYNAWGESVAGYSALSTPRHGFGAAEADGAVGTYTFGARTYDPTLRRWLSPDPLFASSPQRDQLWGEQLNLYQYAGNNPVRSIDPFGFERNDPFYIRYAKEARGVVSGVLGAVGLDPPVKKELAKDADYLFGKGLGQVALGTAVAAQGLSMVVAGGTGEVVTVGGATPVAVPVAAAGVIVVVAGGAIITEGQVTLQMAAAKRGGGGGEGRSADGKKKFETGQDVQDQAEDIKIKQQQSRKNGQPQRIESTKKSDQRMDNALKQLKTSADSEEWDWLEEEVSEPEEPE